MPPVVYDKAKYHDDTIQELGLPEEHAANHTVFFLRWLIEHSLMSEVFETEGAQVLAAFRTGDASIHQLYDWWDRSLVDDMLSDEGNAFAQTYFDFEQGQYLKDYAHILQRTLPSEFHVSYTEENYQAIRVVIDRRYLEWRSASRP
jgi:hypothetical protein